MKIKFSKKFKKQFTKFPSKVKSAFELRLELFISNPRAPLLRAHKLSGELKDYSSFSVTGDYRAIYRIDNETIYIFEMIGTHSELYK
ncbi:MAG TPA: type II toxin-antitoxin system mRNA interferase toxin, RelE/StbE family [Candidatus Saccharibacteria bacterium]|jgi:addiction module RelE/StbE family toxin|nr:type II toxin-antitoxin system mRNA interferase toxin, RelE/StbE family [Candidatus Saccharibacteria bacterium]